MIASQAEKYSHYLLVPIASNKEWRQSRTNQVQSSLQRNTLSIGPVGSEHGPVPDAGESLAINCNRPSHVTTKAPTPQQLLHLHRPTSFLPSGTPSAGLRKRNPKELEQLGITAVL